MEQSYQDLQTEHLMEYYRESVEAVNEEEHYKNNEQQEDEELI